MGKIYEAAQRAEHTYAAKTGGAFGEAAGRSNHDGQNHVDFIRYSIDMPPALNRENAGSDIAARPVDHLVDFVASHQASLEMTRIDPHLTAINEFDPAASEEFSKLAMRLISASEEQPLK